MNGINLGKYLSQGVADGLAIGRMKANIVPFGDMQQAFENQIMLGERVTKDIQRGYENDLGVMKFLENKKSNDIVNEGRIIQNDLNKKYGETKMLQGLQTGAQRIDINKNTLGKQERGIAREEALGQISSDPSSVADVPYSADASQLGTGNYQGNLSQDITARQGQIGQMEAELGRLTSIPNPTVEQIGQIKDWKSTIALEKAELGTLLQEQTIQEGKTKRAQSREDYVFQQQNKRYANGSSGSSSSGSDKERNKANIAHEKTRAGLMAEISDLTSDQKDINNFISRIEQGATEEELYQEFFTGRTKKEKVEGKWGKGDTYKEVDVDEAISDSLKAKIKEYRESKIFLDSFGDIKQVAGGSINNLPKRRGIINQDGFAVGKASTYGFKGDKFEEAHTYGGMNSIGMNRGTQPWWKNENIPGIALAPETAKAMGLSLPKKRGGKWDTSKSKLEVILPNGKRAIAIYDENGMYSPKYPNSHNKLIDFSEQFQSKYGVKGGDTLDGVQVKPLNGSYEPTPTLPPIMPGVSPEPSSGGDAIPDFKF